MSKLRWVSLEESYTWYPDSQPDEDKAHRYEDGRTLREMFPEQHKQVPEGLFQELEDAYDKLNEVVKKIDNYK